MITQDVLNTARTLGRAAQRIDSASPEAHLIEASIETLCQAFHLSQDDKEALWGTFLDAVYARQPFGFTQ